MAQRAPHEVAADDAKQALYRKLDFFPTPPWAARAMAELIRELDPDAQSIWEPTCGEGHMAEPFKEYFDPAKVIASDIYDHGYGIVYDFLGQPMDLYADWIVTNPPFLHAKNFVERGLEFAARGVAIFARLSFLETDDRYELIWGDIGIHRTIAVFSERVAIQLGSWNPELSSATAYCCVIWNKVLKPKRWPDARAIPPGTRDRLWRADDARRFAKLAPAPLFDGEAA